MKIKLANGCTYTIPKSIVPTCKYIQIGYSRVEVELLMDSIHERRKKISEHNEELLIGYTHIGWKELKWHCTSDFYVEIHWFVPTIKLRECRCDPTDQKVYKV